VFSTPGTSVVGHLPEIAGRAAWRYRWQLTPVAGVAGVVGATALAPALTPVVLAGAGAGAWWAARTAKTVRGRMLLSVRERTLAAWWFTAASLWAAWAAIPVLPGSGAPAVLVTATAWPAIQWGRSRRVRRPAPVLSAGAIAVIDRWSEAIALRGPAPLLGSAIITGTMSEPADGAYAFTVQLAEDVHGRDASAESARRAIETHLRLPVDTAAVAPDRDDATRVHVTLTPARHLETTSVPWPGPEITDDGQIPIAARPDGTLVQVAHHDRNGVRHGLFSGTSDAGKSTLISAWILVGPASGISVVWFIDGKGGTSCPRIRHACDWYATKPHQWTTVIDTLYGVFLARRDRRGDAHQDVFSVGTETDPVIELWIDEASAVAKRLTAIQHEWVLEMLQEGRALGIRIVQGAQDVMATGIVGGRQARDLMAGNGAVIALRPGGSMAKRLTLDSTSIDIDLMALPPEPGFAAIIQKGQVLAEVARIRFAERDAAEAAAKAITVRHLTGPDLEAAGAAYADRRNPTPPADDRASSPRQRQSDAGRTGGAPPVDTGDTSEEPDNRARAAEAYRRSGRPLEPLAGQVRTARDIVADALASVDQPVTRGWIAERTDLAHSTVTKALTELEAEGRAQRAGAQRWRAIP
jgi:hypothetical protein